MLGTVLFGGGRRELVLSSRARASHRAMRVWILSFFLSFALSVSNFGIARVTR